MFLKGFSSILLGGISAVNLPSRRSSESRRKGTVVDRRNGMNLKAYIPIIALCTVTFAVSFAGGLWWELSQQDEWQTSESSAQNVKQSIAQRRTDKEKSDQESKADKERVKTDDEKDKPAEAEKTEEGSETRPDEVTPESPVAPNISPAVPSNAIRVRGGMKRMDMSNMSAEQRAQVEEAMRTARQAAARGGGRVISSVEISSDSDSSITVTDETEMIIAEPDN